MVFCVGGPYGHSNEVRSRANEIIKLSDMVLNHQVSSSLALLPLLCIHVTCLCSSPLQISLTVRMYSMAADKYF